MAGQSQGAISKLAIDGVQMEYLRIEDQSRIELVDNGDEANRGIFDHSKERVSQGLKFYTFKITMNPSPTELDVLLLLLGTTESPTDTFIITDTLPSFTMILGRVAKVHTYSLCYVDKWKFSGAKGRKPIQLELTIFATTESEGSSFSASAIDTDIAYVFTEGVLTLEASARAFNQFALAGDNKLNREFNNTQTASSICQTDRVIELAASAPYTSSETDLLTTPESSSAGAAATLVYTRSTRSITFSLANAKAIRRPPSMAKEEIRLPLFYKIYRSGSTESLIITHDNTV